MEFTRLSGLVAATYTPLNAQGELHLPAIGPLVEQLLGDGVAGLYVCGSTGEGMSLTSEERKAVSASYVAAADGRLPVIVQVGHNSLHEACALAEHAQAIGASAISATCPSYFKISSTTALVKSMQTVAAGAPELPFYYYHIPTLTGSQIDMLEFLVEGAAQIPNLCGLKFTAAAMDEFQQCVEWQDGRLDVVWGFDEMLLGALATGANAAIGSTYNIAARLYTRLIDAFSAGDLPTARKLQSQSIAMIRALNQFPFHAAMKAVLRMKGHEVGGCRLPQDSLSEDECRRLRSRLESIDFFQWS